jgi:hypothetical protein
MVYGMAAHLPIDRNMQTRATLLTSTMTVATLAALAFLMSTATASAQYQPRPLNDPATGESWHIEGAADYWFPTADMVVASESLGIRGSDISLKRDLGVTDRRLPSFQLQLRPSERHKFRLQYTPIKYVASATVQQQPGLIFNGIRYDFALPVNTLFDWKAYRFGYEFDFVSKNRGFVGFILEAKYTDVQVHLTSPLRAEFARARGPIPAIGGIARVYVVPNISITGEMTGFKIPDTIDDRYKAHYFDIDIYGTVNFTDHVGVKGGYRSTDVGYLIKSDSGTFKLKGIYFGGVLRY